MIVALTQFCIYFKHEITNNLNSIDSLISTSKKKKKNNKNDTKICHWYLFEIQYFKV